MVELPAFSGKICYKSTTSVMEYMPGFLPARNLAASRGAFGENSLGICGVA